MSVNGEHSSGVGSQIDLNSTGENSDDAIQTATAEQKVITRFHNYNCYGLSFLEWFKRYGNGV